MTFLTYTWANKFLLACRNHVQLKNIVSHFPIMAILFPTAFRNLFYFGIMQCMGRGEKVPALKTLTLKIRGYTQCLLMKEWKCKSTVYSHNKIQP